MNIDFFAMLERESGKRSFFHGIDTSIMIIFSLAVIVYAVMLRDVLKLIFLETFLLCIMGLARLNPGYVAKRFAWILPFGVFLALFQPFFRPGEVVFQAYGVTLTRQGIDIAILLLLRLFIAASAIIILSSTSTIPQILEGLRRLKFPKVMILIINIMIRYLYLFLENTKRTTKANMARCFTIRKNPAGYRWVLKQLGYLISGIFIKAYEQGERLYNSMLSRGYDMNARYAMATKRRLAAMDFSIFMMFAGVVIFLEVGLPGLVPLL